MPKIGISRWTKKKEKKLREHRAHGKYTFGFMFLCVCANSDKIPFIQPKSNKILLVRGDKSKTEKKNKIQTNVAKIYFRCVRSESSAVTNAVRRKAERIKTRKKKSNVNNMELPSQIILSAIGWVLIFHIWIVCLCLLSDKE